MLRFITKVLILTVTLSWSSILYTWGQDKPTLNLSEIYSDALNPENQNTGQLFYSDRTIIIDDLSAVQGGFPQDSLARMIMKTGLYFQSCDFPFGLSVQNLNTPSLTLSGSNLMSVNISNSSIDVLTLDGNDITANIMISNAGLQNLSITNNQIGTATEIIENKIKGGANIGDNSVNEIFIENNKVELTPGNWFNNYVFNGSSEYDLHLIGNTFKGDSTTAVILSSNYLNLEINNNTFEPNLFLSHSGVQERFLLAQNVFDSHISFEDFLFSETRNEVYWEQLAGYKLAYSNEGVLYNASSSEELSDDISFKNLVSNYKMLHQIFIGRGDLESANACYSEMKELQGRKLKSIYQSEGTFENFFRWQLNRLLKLYTNHGTDPALAVVISFYVILTFAVFYLFFPSDWDRTKFKYPIKLEEGQTRMSYLKDFIIHFLNAITLSINSFITLGFGSIPTRGFARYLCIIEGFLGWFLLSIFTVALINQVLA